MILRRLFATGALILAALSCATYAAAATVTLAWDPDPSPTIAGYLVYYGIASQVYTNHIDVGDGTTATITGLVPGATYYFAVASYDTNGLQSPLSGEISYTVPVSTIIAPTLRLTTNASHQHVVTGTGVPGQAYDVLASSNFLTWTVIGSVTADASGALQFIDTNAPSTSCFYRLRQSSWVASSPAQLRLTTGSGAQMVLTGAGTAGYTFEVQASKDLSSWTVIGSVTADASGAMKFTDTNAPGRCCFYRLRQTSP